jgi:PIN domain nuclease of toxin-antitoxin system
MNVLLDSHTLIWFYTGAEQLSEKAKSLIEKNEITCYFSMASIWEMAIKIRLNKMNIGVSLQRFVEDVMDNGIQLLPVELPHILKTQVLEFHHRDPFDRLIFAQAMTENMILLSADAVADLYFEQTAVKRVW